jgi:hypothetical protein
MPWLAEPEDRTVATERAMAAVCTACPVQLECASYAETRAISAGFWSGFDRAPLEDASDGVA